MTNNETILLTEELVNKLFREARIKAEEAGFDISTSKGAGEATFFLRTEIIKQTIELLRSQGWLISPPLPIEDAPTNGIDFIAVHGSIDLMDFAYINEGFHGDTVPRKSDTHEPLNPVKYIYRLPQPSDKEQCNE